MIGPENHATVTLDSSITSQGMKTYSESTIEIRNLQILKEIIEMSTQFLSSKQRCEPKNLNVALNITGVEKYAQKTCSCSQQWRSFNLIFELKEHDGGNLCPLWLVILKSV